jgi:hypothetical protein
MRYQSRVVPFMLQFSGIHTFTLAAGISMLAVTIIIL